MNLQYNPNPYGTTFAKLMSYARLPRDWHFGRGGAIDSSVIKDADEVLRTGHSCGFTHSDVFPGVDGQVLVTFYQNPDHYVQVSIDGPTSFEVMYEKNDEEKLREICSSIAQVSRILTRIYGGLWPTRYASGSMFPNIGIVSRNDSWTSHLSLPRTAVGSLYSMKIVQSNLVEPFAFTNVNSTQASLEHQAQFGDSTTTHFRMAQAS